MRDVGPRDQEVREIRARDQQHEPDRGLQDDERLPHAADDVVVQRIEADLVVVGFGTWPVGTIVRHCSSSRSTSASACARVTSVLQPADQVEAVTAARVRQRCRVDGERLPDLDLRIVHVVSRAA